jgi:hypothetical protein
MEPGTGMFAGSVMACFGTTTGLSLEIAWPSAAVATAESSAALTVNALANNASGTSGAICSHPPFLAWRLAFAIEDPLRDSSTAPTPRCGHVFWSVQATVVFGLTAVFGVGYAKNADSARAVTGYLY